MKKYIVSILVLGTFGSYALYQQSEAGSTPVVATAMGNSNRSESAKSVNQPYTPLPLPDPVAATKPIPTPKPTPTAKPSGQYKNGTYTGVSADAYYGRIEVQAVISNNKLVDVVFLDHPNDRGTSVRINNHAMPILKTEAISAQSASVNTVSGATDSSGAFRVSLSSALLEARNM